VLGFANDIRLRTVDYLAHRGQYAAARREISHALLLLCRAGAAAPPSDEQAQRSSGYIARAQSRLAAISNVLASGVSREEELKLLRQSPGAPLYPYSEDGRTLARLRSEHEAAVVVATAFVSRLKAAVARLEDFRLREAYRRVCRCEGCGRWFLQQHGNRKYHSTSCRRAALAATKRFVSRRRFEPKALKKIE
jgi:hypothetical protein